MSSLRRRLIVTASLAAIAALTLAGCSVAGTGSSGSGSARVKLSGVIANATDPFWISVMCGGTAEAKRRGIDLKWYTSPTTSAQSMSQNFDSATLAKPDGLFLNPFQATQFSTQVKSLMSKGVPVIASTPLDPATEHSDLPFDTDGSNFTSQVTSVLPDKVGSVVALGGIPTLDVLKAEWQPLEDAIAKAHPEATMLPTQYTDFDVTKSTQIVSSLLLAHPDLTMVIASTGPEGEGAAAAIKQAGKAGTVKIWAYDATPAEVASLKSGVITVLAAKPAQKMGAAAIEQLADLIAQNPKKKPVMRATSSKPLPLTIITKANVDSAEAKAAVYATSCAS